MKQIANVIICLSVLCSFLSSSTIWAGTVVNGGAYLSIGDGASGDLEIKSGSIFTLGSSATLKLSGDWTNSESYKIDYSVNITAQKGNDRI
jgi:hypothetical protein